MIYTMVVIYVACGIMTGQDPLPFKAGQLAESRSFKVGYRGAWFRCKIIKTMSLLAFPRCRLEYYDYPGDEVIWFRMYQKSQKGPKGEPTLMLRPQYPHIYNESEVVDVNTISEVSVVKVDEWKVGDDVDWYTDGCYWSGKVTKILRGEKVEIELPPPPTGEGSPYSVPCKDLRPSLDWSVEHGWSVPISKGGEDRRPCARLIKPVDKGPQISKFDALCETVKDFQSIAGSSSDLSFSSDTSSSLPLDVKKPKENIQNLKANSIARTSCSDNVSTSHIKDSSAQNNCDEADHSSDPGKRMRTSVPLNSTKSDTLEATVLDLEELVNKVKWLKGILRSGRTSSNAQGPSWEFVDLPISYKPK